MEKNLINDTIAAIATPLGRGGVAIVRVSGPLTKQISHLITNHELVPRHAAHTPFLDEKGDILDEGIALFFANPHSFTGEDVLELHGHGGPVIVDLILKRLLNLGARLARPGEFSERAFLNGKIDLTQAEAIADLIDATSEQAARLAVRSLQGEFSRVIHVINENIIHLRMYVEAAIDFSDEEIDFLSDKKITSQLSDILKDLRHIQQQAKQGSFLREGMTAVIAGKPNVGKSSLLNALSGKDLAIVTDIPGTTRDVLRDYILIDDMPMHIIDTAGLRDSHDIVELEGIRRAQAEIEKADLILSISDSRETSALEMPRYNKNIIHVRNKIDLTNETPTLKTGDQITVSLSAKTGAGVDLLKSTIKQLIGFTNQGEGLFLARRRHLDALSRAEQHVSASLRQLKENQSGELAAEDLRLAHRALGEITGEFSTDDLLGRIFSTFCVGK